MLKNFSDRQATVAIVHELGQPCFAHMKNMVNVVHSKTLKTIAISKKSFLKRWSWEKELFYEFSQKTWSPRLQKVHQNLDTCLRHLQFEGSKKLSRVYSKNLIKEIIFTNEKIFTLEQNNGHCVCLDIVQGQSKSPAILTGHHPFSVMVCAVEWGYCHSFLHAMCKNNGWNLWRNRPRAYYETVQW